MSEATFTFRVEESLKQDFSSFAKTMDRSGAQLLRDFMRDFVKQQQEQVQIGLDEANAGKLIPHEEVKSQFEEKRARLLAKLAAQ